MEDHKANIEALKAQFPDGHKSHYKKQKEKRADRGENPKPARTMSKAEKRALRDGRRNPR